MLSKCCLVANLQYLRITIGSAGFEHQRSGTGPAAYQWDDAELINSVSQIVAVRVLAQYACPAGTQPEPSQANGDIEVCTTRKSAELRRRPKVVLDAAVAGECLAERKHGRRRRHDCTASLITARTARERSRSADRSPPLRASPSSGPPMLTAAAPAASQSRVASRSTPPDGMPSRSGKGPRRCFRYAAPTVSAGKILTAVAPASQPAASSVGVRPPGKTAIPRSTASLTTARLMVGVTRYCAPESKAC